MEINWNISASDIARLTGFMREHSLNLEVNERIARNIQYQNLELNQDKVICSLLYGLLFHNPKYRKMITLIQAKPFPFQYGIIANVHNIKEYIQLYFKQNGFILDENKIPDFFATNVNLLEAHDWDLLNSLSKLLYKKTDKQAERAMADQIDTMFKGFGAIEARIFLQHLGLSKYEIPLDTVISDWFNDFGFPITMSVAALQDRNFYHFVSDGIQLLCEKVEVYPCVLEAAIRVECAKKIELAH